MPTPKQRLDEAHATALRSYRVLDPMEDGTTDHEDPVHISALPCCTAPATPEKVVAQINAPNVAASPAPDGMVKPRDLVPNLRIGAPLPFAAPSPEACEPYRDDMDGGTPSPGRTVSDAVVSDSSSTY